MKYTVVLPCRNEEGTIGICIRKIRKVLPSAEIIVVDNSSNDQTAAIAKKHHAILIKEPKIGYGAAIMAGLNKAKGDYLITCDADNTYDLEELPKLIKHDKYDIVIGNRFNDSMKKRSMPILHRYLGNPLLSRIMRSFFNLKVRDCHSGFRMIKRAALDDLNLRSLGMEFASEMLIKAAQKNMIIKEVPVTYSPRTGESKLKPFNDGWRHIKIMLLESPNHLFLVPGISFFLLGTLILCLLLLFNPLTIFGWEFHDHPSIIGGLSIILGYQIILLWLYTKTYNISNLQAKEPLVESIHKYFRLERTIILGSIIFIGGLAMLFYLLYSWHVSNYSRLYYWKESVIGFTLMIIGVQTIFSGFLLSILGIKHK